MNASELFSRMSPDTARGILAWFRESQRDMYRGAIVSLAPLRRLRPEFVTRKSAADQIAWILDQLKRRSGSEIAENLLQIWLIKGRSDMLVSFLNGIGVSHDGKGGIEEDIPSTLDAEAVRAAVETLLQNHPAEEVAIYLHLFQLQQPDGWPEIAAALDSHPALRFAEPAA